MNACRKIESFITVLIRAAHDCFLPFCPNIGEWGIHERMDTARRNVEMFVRMFMVLRDDCICILRKKNEIANKFNFGYIYSYLKTLETHA